MDLRCSAQADVITYMRYGSFAASMTGNVIFAGRQMALLQWQAAPQRYGDMVRQGLPTKLQIDLRAFKIQGWQTPTSAFFGPRAAVSLSWG